MTRTHEERGDEKQDDPVMRYYVIYTDHSFYMKDM